METKKLSKRLSSKKSIKSTKKNPYSDRGMDKFSSLLAEIEEKKKIIYSKLNPEDISMIRFVHAGDNKLKPVIVTTNNKAYKFKIKVEEDEVKHVIEDDQLIETKKREEEDEVVDKEKDFEFSKEVKINIPSFDVHPWFYMLGGMVIMVLLLMVMFGKYWKSFYLLQLQATICPKAN